MGKGFALNHTKLTLDCSLNGTAAGSVELQITPYDPALKTVYLHARELAIKAVTVNGLPATFVYNQAIKNVLNTPPASNNIRSTYPEFKRKLFQATNEEEEGELGILLPPGSVKKAGSRGASLVPGGAVTTDASPDPAAAKGQLKEPEFESLQIIIDYEIRDSRDGIHAVGPSDLYPHRIPHCYTSAATADSARCWVPCVDSLWERCTWEMVFSVPRVLSFEQETDQGGIEVEEFPIVMVASGELLEQVVHPHNPNKTIFHFAQATPTTVQHIAFAYGPFSILDLSPSASQVTGDPAVDEDIEAEALALEAEGQLQMHAFCLPGREDELQNSVGFMTRALEFFLEEFGSYPFNSFKLVFVDDSPVTMFNSAAMGLFSTDLLHSRQVIDQAYETRQTLSYSLAAQWVGINIIQKTWADTWLIQGLSLYVNSLWLRRMMGNNEYRFRLKKDVTRCCAWDIKMPPLCQPGILHPPSADILPFINLKAPLVLHTLDRQLLKAGTHNGLSRVIPKLYLSAISGDLKENLLSTHNFLRICKKVSGGGSDLKNFQDQWIYSNGCPKFHIAATFNRKRMAVELAIKQESPAWAFHTQADWLDKVDLRPVHIFEGQMAVRIHEADGTPYEHVIDIREGYKKHEVGFNTKYKRIRRSTKRFQARKAAEEAAAAGDQEAIEAVGNIDTSFSLPLWEDARNDNTEKERELWRVAEWTEEDEKAQEQAVYEWIRIDTEFEWLAVINFEQPDFMWLSQLQRDRDVVAQLEAVHALARMQTAVVSSNLAKTALVTNYFYRIRMEAALALITTAHKSVDYLGLFYLLKIFQRSYCFEPEVETADPFAFRCVPRPNDFTDLAEYHLRKTLIVAISHIRDEKGNPFPQIQQFLVDLLTYNDNAQNGYSDSFYITTIIAALGNTFVSANTRDQSEFAAIPNGSNFTAPKEQQLLHAAVDEVTRYTNLDRLVPSYHNVITVAGIEWRVKMMMASLLPLDLRALFAYTREGNLPAVRMAAFDGLLLLRALQEKVIARYVLAVLRFDSCRIVQRRLAQSLVENLPILAAMDELAGQEAEYVEEDAKAARKQSSQSVDSLLKALRNSVGRSIMLRDSMMAVLLSPNSDMEVRWCILKLCEVLIKPSEEPLPKLKIKMPANVLRLSSNAAGARAGSPDVPLSVATGQSILPKIKFGGQDVARSKENGEAQAAPALKLVLGSGNKKTKQLKQQKSGMSMQDLKVCQNLMAKITASKNKKADLFRRPVDPIRDGAPSYFEHIKQPMDLSTISNKLDAGLYKDRFALRDDFKLMIANCYLFNGKESIPGKLADAMDAFFDKQWDRANATLEQLRLRATQANGDAAAPSVPAMVNGAEAVPVNGHTTPAVPDASAVAVEAPEVFVAPQPPTPAPAATSSSNTLRPLFKLKLSTSPNTAAQPPPKEAVPDPIKPEVETPVLPPTPLAATQDSAPAFSRPPSEAPLPQAALPPQQASPSAANGRDSRSASPNVPLAITAPAAANRPKIKFMTKPKPKPEPVDEQFEFAAPAPPSRRSTPMQMSPGPMSAPTSQPSSRRTSPVAETTTHRPTFRLSLGGSNAAPAPPIPQPQYTPSMEPAAYDTYSAPSPAPSLTMNNGHRPSQGPFVRAASVSSAGDPYAPVNYKKMAALVRKLLSLPEAFFFQRPVDPIADGCPTYYDEIKRPMDLGTIQSKLHAGMYQTQGELNDDFEQIVINCKLFNPPATLPVIHAEALQRIWRSEVAKAVKMSYQEKRALQGMMNRLRTKPSAAIFLEAVDPEMLGIPLYFQVIDRADARDMSLIKRRLDNDEYSSFEAFEADFRLMLRNCYVFNGEGSPAYEVGKVLEAEFDREFEVIKSQLAGGISSNKPNAKRQSTGGPSGSGTIKKIKFSTGY